MNAARAVSGYRRFAGTVLVGGVALSVVLAGCGSSDQHASSPADSPGSVSSPQTPAATHGASDPVRFRYSVVFAAEDEDELRQDWEVIADGDRVRWTFTGGSEGDVAPGFWQVWDGSVLLTYDPDGDPPFARDVNPAKDEIPSSSLSFLQPGGKAFNEACVSARRVGTTTIAGRKGVTYACAASDAQDGTAESAHEMILDQASGLLLRDSGDGFTYNLTEVTFAPVIADGTFSTDLPRGAGDAAHPAVEDFRLPKLGGGTLAYADYRGLPLVIVVGEARGLRKTLKRLLPLTGGGTKPPVIAMLNPTLPGDWCCLDDPGGEQKFADAVSRSAGRFAVPTAIDIKGGTGEQFRLIDQIPADRIAIALIRSDGNLDRVVTDAATDGQLGNRISGLS